MRRPMRDHLPAMQGQGHRFKAIQGLHPAQRSLHRNGLILRRTLPSNAPTATSTRTVFIEPSANPDIPSSTEASSIA
jgi:hypothetical protein